MSIQLPGTVVGFVPHPTGEVIEDDSFRTEDIVGPNTGTLPDPDEMVTQNFGVAVVDQFFMVAANVEVLAVESTHDVHCVAESECPPEHVTKVIDQITTRDFGVMPFDQPFGHVFERGEGTGIRFVAPAGQDVVVSEMLIAGEMTCAHFIS